MSEQDGKIVNLGGLKKFKEYYDTDIITPINNKINSKTNVQSGEIITTNNDTIGYFKNIKINGNTRYKKSDGTYTDTWESGVSLESMGEKEKNSNGKYPIIIKSSNDTKEDKRTVLLDSPLRKNDVLDLEKLKITRNYGSATFNGEEEWAVGVEHTNTILFDKTLGNSKPNYIMCDKFIYNTSIWGVDTEGCRISNNGSIQINISKSKLETQDVAGFKKWLQSNPVTVVYQLATPITEDIEVSSNTLTDFATSCTLTINNTIKGNIECNEVVGLIPSVEEDETRLANLQNSLDNKAEKNHTHTISNVTGLQDKLDEVFQSVSNGKTLLETAITDKGSSVSKAGDVATFEELKTGIAGISTGVCELNIFTQTTEPSTKDGLWLKTSNTYDDVEYGGTPDTYTKMADIPYGFYYGSAVSVGNNIYILGGYDVEKYNYKYYTTTNTYTKMADIPYGFKHGSAVAIGNDIYLLGGDNSKTNNYKYDTTTNTYTKMADIPYGFKHGSAVAIGNDIYLLGTEDSSARSKYNYKYDTTTNTYTKMTDIPYGFNYGSAVSIGNDIYLLGGYDNRNNNYKYYTTTNTYTKMTDISYKFYDCSAVAIGNNIYLLGGYGVEKYNYKYDTTTNTYTKMADIPYGFRFGSAVAIGNNIYILGTDDSSARSKNNYKYDTINIYKNSILFLYDNESFFKYKTKIFNTSYERLGYINFNSVIMTDENGNNLNVETYIGNGNSWDKI